MLASLLEPNSQNHGMSCELIAMPYGFDFGVGELTSLISPVAGSSRPTMFAPRTVNHRMPRRSNIGVCGSRAFGSDSLQSVNLPVFGSSLPM